MCLNLILVVLESQKCPISNDKILGLIEIKFTFQTLLMYTFLGAKAPLQIAMVYK